MVLEFNSVDFNIFPFGLTIALIPLLETLIKYLFDSIALAIEW